MLIFLLLSLFYHLVHLEHLLASLLCDLDQHGVSAQEGDDSNHDQIFHCSEHVKLEPEAVIEAKDSSKAQVKSNGRG